MYSQPFTTLPSFTLCSDPSALSVTVTAKFCCLSVLLSPSRQSGDPSPTIAMLWKACPLLNPF